MSRIKSVNQYMIASFAFTLIAHVLRIGRTINIDILSDEMGTLATAAHLAGLDWSGSFLAGRYYGGGYYWIFAPLLILIDNPYLIFVMIYAVNSVFVALISVLIYHILVNYFYLGHSYRAVFYSIVPGTFFRIVDWDYISNEVPLYIVFWCILFFLLKGFITDSWKKRIWYTIAVGLLMSYTLTLHERAIAIWIGIILALLLIRIFMKKKIVDLRVILPVLIIGYIATRLFKELLLNTFWYYAPVVINTEVFGSIGSFFLEDILGFKTVIDIMVANVISGGFISFGLILFSITIAAIFVVYFIKERGKMELSDTQIMGVLLLLISLFNFIIIIGGLGVQWGAGVYERRMSGEILGSSIRAFNYYRYYAAFIGGMLIIPFVVLEKKWISKKMLCITTFILSTVLTFYYFVFIHYYYIAQWHTVLRFGGADPFTMWRNLEATMRTRGILMSFFFLFCIIFSVLFSKMPWKIYPILVILGIGISNISYGGVQVPTFVNYRAGGTRAFINQHGLAEELEHLYTDSGPYNFQFMMKNLPIIPGHPEEGVMVSNLGPLEYRSNITHENGFMYKQLGSSEWIYVSSGYVEVFTRRRIELNEMPVLSD